MAGEEEKVIEFQSGDCPLFARDLNHDLYWYHNNATNHINEQEVTCDGSQFCSMVTKNQIHELSASFTIPRQYIVSYNSNYIN
ncbi:unnamed protein product [Diamesa serratosioi]